MGAANIGWADRVGAIEKGKFTDIIGVSGDPSKDVTELERVKFVMKSGQVFRNDFETWTVSTAANQGHILEKKQ